MRSYLEETKEAHREGSVSAKGWRAVKAKYPDRPTIVLSGSAKGTGYQDRVWEEGQWSFVQDVVGRGLVRWDKEWTGSCAGPGNQTCRDALNELVRTS